MITVVGLLDDLHTVDMKPAFLKSAPYRMGRKNWHPSWNKEEKWLIILLKNTISFMVNPVQGMGSEASLAASRMGAKRSYATINIEMLAFMPCNPSIVVLLKGLSCVKSMPSVEMAKNIDKTYIKWKCSIPVKVCSFRALRAQADNELYSKKCRKRSKIKKV